MLEEIREFAAQLRVAFAQHVRGQAEEQLKRPVAELLEAAGRALLLDVHNTGEIVTGAGRPDIGVLVGAILSGHVELKAPRENVDPDRMRGRNKVQWNKFKSLPNLIYTNGRDWRLYQLGQLVTTVSFVGEPTEEGGEAVSPENGGRLAAMLEGFLRWTPVVPRRAAELARFLAPIARLLRDDVHGAVDANSIALTSLRDEWRAYLFPDFSNAEFADAYAQTVTSALLLARLEGADIRVPGEAERALRAENSLLGRILRILTQEEVREEISLGLSVLERVMMAIQPDQLEDAADPWLYFYEDFLRAYNPALARDAGVYYTPAQIVRFQVRLVSELLENRFGKTYSFAHEGVTVIDPALGTGTYLVAAIQTAMEVVERRAGAQRPARAVELAKNLIGFELLIGPYSVAHLRLSRELVRAAGDAADNPLQEHELKVFLADTLDSPAPPNEGLLIPLMHRPLAQERERARQIKADQEVIVCIGNPPYDRQMEEGADRKGGWIRFGDARQDLPVFEDFLEPARRAGEGVNLRSIYNDYVYFWRWALWKVFDNRAPGDATPGIVSFITGSSYLSGPGFVGMREYMRRCFDELWIIDLGGDSLGARREPNVFAIQTPVAIAIGVRNGAANNDQPAETKYVRISGSRTEKLTQLEALRAFADVDWRDCPNDWHAPFKPALEGVYAAWPSLRQLFPWQHNGSQFVRTWPIAPTAELLTRRWTELMQANTENRRVLFKESRDRDIEWSSARVSLPGSEGPPLIDLPEDAPPPAPVRYAYRSFDRQWALIDGRLGDYLKPTVWEAHGPDQLYMTTLLATALGYGPAATFSSIVPDLHHFRGSFGGKDLIPLYRDTARRPNITGGLLRTLSATYGVEVQPLDLFCYVAGILGCRAFVSSFWTELETPGINVPLTKSRAAFQKAVEVGRRFIRAQTFNDRLGDGPLDGEARIAVDIPHLPERYPASYDYDEPTSTLSVGDGRLASVSEAVWNYEVSGFRVLESWLGYRMAGGQGRTSSPLDRLRPRSWTAGMTEELLEVVWALEACIAAEPEALAALNGVLVSELFEARELPRPTPPERAAPVAGVRPEPFQAAML